MFEEFTRRTFVVKAVRVTAENIEDLAKHLGVEVETDEEKYGYTRFIRVMCWTSNRRTQPIPTLVGDWITYSNEHYHRYANKKFQNMFKPCKMDDEMKKTLVEMFQQAMNQQDVATYHGQSNSVNDVPYAMAERVMKLIGGRNSE